MADGMIALFQGSRGSGKTLTLTQVGVEYLQLGWKVYSNFEASFCEEMTNEEILALDKNSDLRDCVILVDELQILFDSRLWKSSTAVNFSHFIQQIRKRNIIIIGSTQYVDTVEKRIRQHVDLLICPKIDEDTFIVTVTVYDLTSIEDIENPVPLSYTYYYYAEPLFSLYDTNKII